jgi:hypothetical protein
MDFKVSEKIKLEIDSDDIKENLPQISFILNDPGTPFNGHIITASFFLEKLYNAYRKSKCPDSPVLLKDGISVLKDTKSLVIQAADVIGNFSTSYIYYKLGNKSKRRILKGQIFETIFKENCSSKNDFSQDIDLIGDNDFQLKKDGAFTFRLGKYS